MLFISSFIIVSVYVGRQIRDTDKTSWRYALGSDNYYKSTWQGQMVIKIVQLNVMYFKKEYISVEKGKNNTLNFSVRFY